MDLPKTYWDTRDCPEFVPAAGVFRYTYWRVGFVDEETDESIGVVERRVTCIRRSKGWLVQGGQPVPAPEDEKPKPIYAPGSLEWEQEQRRHKNEAAPG